MGGLDTRAHLGVSCPEKTHAGPSWLPWLSNLGRYLEAGAQGLDARLSIIYVLAAGSVQVSMHVSQPVPDFLTALPPMHDY